jgi:DNA-binding response OmpR family regulator
LSLSKELAERMGGSLSVESSPGKGSSFTFYLPARETGEILPFEQGFTSLKFTQKETLNILHDQELPVVLIIEDNAELRAFIRQSIAGGWQVVEASNGGEGIRKALEILPDLIISDLMMPVKDGYEVCKTLRNESLTAHIPIILLSAKTSIDARITGLRSGADDYLSKPFHTGELQARMENLVELRRKLRQRYGNLTYAVSTPTDAEQTESFLSAPDREFLRKLRLTLEQQLRDETLSTDTLAQLLDINRMQLHRKLKAISNQSATEFIRKYRLERAMALLKNREGNVKQVSAMVGFGNEKYFSSTFKEHFGISPSDVLSGTLPSNKAV